LEVDPAFITNVLFTDEVGFTRDGVFNFHGHVWAKINPRATRETSFQHRFSINVWAGIVGDRLIGHICYQITFEARLIFDS
jgi:hypothetical protein